MSIKAKLFIVIFTLGAVIVTYKYAVPCMTALLCTFKFTPQALPEFWSLYAPSFNQGWEYVALTWPDSEAASRLVSVVLVSLIVGIGFTALVFSQRSYKKSIFGQVGAKTNAKGSGCVELDERVLATTTYSWNPDGKPPKNGGMVYGYSLRHHRYYISRPEAHTLLVAPPGTGKTMHHIIPAILSFIYAQKTSAVIFDPQRELYDATAQAARDAGADVYLYDYRHTEASNLFNPLHTIVKVFDEGLVRWNATIKQAALTAQNGDAAQSERLCMEADAIRRKMYALSDSLSEDLATILIPKLPDDGNGAFWKESGQGLLQAVSLLVATYRVDDWTGTEPAPFEPEPEQRTLETVLFLISELGGEIREQSNGKVVSYTPLERLFGNIRQDHPAVSAFSTIKISKGQTLSGICSTATTAIKQIINAETNAISYTSDLDFEDIASKKTFVYIVAPGERPSKGAYAITFVTQMYQALVPFAKASGGRLPYTVHVVCEELGTMRFPIPNLDSMLGECRKYGMNFHLVVQYYGQLNTYYGQVVAENIRAIVNVKILLKAADVKSAKELSSRIGKYTIDEEVHTGSRSTTSLLDASTSSRSQQSDTEFFAISDILDWNPEWGTLVWRDFFDKRQSLFARIFMRRDKIEVACYPTASTENQPSSRIFDICPKEKMVLKTLKAEAESNLDARIISTPWDFSSEKESFRRISKQTVIAVDNAYSEVILASCSTTYADNLITKALADYSPQSNMEKYLAEFMEQIKTTTKRETARANYLCREMENAAGLEGPYSCEKEDFRRRRSALGCRWISDTQSRLIEGITMKRAGPHNTAQQRTT